MHIFQSKILFYLSFNLIGLFFMFISMMGTPGNPDMEIRGAKFLSKLLDILASLAWMGIPVLLLTAVVAFCFHWDLMGKLFSILSLGIGLSIFLTMMGFYVLQSRKG